MKAAHANMWLLKISENFLYCRVPSLSFKLGPAPRIILLVSRFQCKLFSGRLASLVAGAGIPKRGANEARNFVAEGKKRAAAVRRGPSAREAGREAGPSSRVSE